jgi:GAF domain-containing protein
VVILIAASIAFLLLARLVIRALRQRAIAEQRAVVAEEQAAQLAVHTGELEGTVALRTQELEHSHALLERELVERKAAEVQLKERDALLRSVAQSAAELLGSPSHEEAITAVLQLVGQTVGVGRVQINEISTDSDGQLRSATHYEWCVPELTPMIDAAPLQSADLTVALPRTVAVLPVGGLSTFFIDDVAGELRNVFAGAHMRSFLQLPVLVEGKLWGSLELIDSAETPRRWSGAETDTLQTLAGLLGAALTSARTSGALVRPVPRVRSPSP